MYLFVCDFFAVDVQYIAQLTHFVDFTGLVRLHQAFIDVHLAIVCDANLAQRTILHDHITIIIIIAYGHFMTRRRQPTKQIHDPSQPTRIVIIDSCLLNNQRFMMVAPLLLLFDFFDSACGLHFSVLENTPQTK